MLTGRYTPEQLIRELRGFGLDLFVGEDGAVHGRFREKGKRMTLEMRQVAAELDGMNDQVAELLRNETRQELVGLTVEQAEEIGALIKAGELELVGMVHYRQETGLVDMTVKGARTDG